MSITLEIKGVRKKGALAEERLVLEAIVPTDIGEYAVFDTTYSTNNSVSNKVRHVFWFPDSDAKIEAGDFVVLYTKKGKNASQKNKRGTTSHFFYWGLDQTIWNSEGDCAVVVKINDWIFSTV